MCSFHNFWCHLSLIIFSRLLPRRRKGLYTSSLAAIAAGKFSRATKVSKEAVIKVANLDIIFNGSKSRRSIMIEIVASKPLGTGFDSHWKHYWHLFGKAYGI